MHPPDDPSRAVSELVEPRGFDTVVVTDADALADEVARGCDLLVVAACWFSMGQERYSSEDRAAYGVGSDAERDVALARVIDAGCPLLALHTAVICFDQWPGWGERLGGAWDWNQSQHPPLATLDVTGVAGALIEVAPFEVVDEEYRNVPIADKSDVIARTSAGHPVMWLRADSRRRVAVDLLGHDHRSLDDPGHRAALGQLLDWLLEPTSAGGRPCET